MTSPISTARISWVQDRLRVVDACIKDLKQRQQFYHQSLSMTYHDSGRAMEALRAELLQLSVELSVLTASMMNRVQAEADAS